MRKYIDYLNGILVFLMFLAIFIQISARLIIKVPTSWSVETGILFFVFIVFIGIASVTRERTHLKVDALFNFLPRRIQRIVDTISSFLFIIFFLLFSVGAYRNVVANWNVEIPTIEWFKWGYVYLIVLAATVINIVYLVMNIVSDILGVQDK